MQLSHNRTKRVAGRMVADEPLWLRSLLILSTYAIIGGLIVVPLVYVFRQALAPGWSDFLDNLWRDPDTRHSIWMTLTVAPVAVLLNTVFGVAAAWTITKFQFPGRTLLVTLLDIPFAVSPVMVGMLLVLLFGRFGLLGPFMQSVGIKILYAWPGLVLVTTFVTMPFVARELIPLMQSLGSDEEMAAVSLGASPWQMFWRITLPNIKWGLVYGIIQCNARAMGEFGAVYVVSGKIAGETDTMPLRVNRLFEDGDYAGSFAVAAALTMMALVTLGGKLLLERVLAAQVAARAKEIASEEA